MLAIGLSSGITKSFYGQHKKLKGNRKCRDMPIASIDWLLNASRRFITGSSAPARNNFEKSVIILGRLNQQMKADHEKWMESSVQKKTLHKRPESKWALWISRTRHQCSKCSMQSHQTAQPMRFFLFVVFVSVCIWGASASYGCKKEGKGHEKVNYKRRRRLPKARIHTVREEGEYNYLSLRAAMCKKMHPFSCTEVVAHACTAKSHTSKAPWKRMLRKYLSFGICAFNNVMTYRTTGCDDFQEREFSFLLFSDSDLAWAIDTRRSHGSHVVDASRRTHTRHTHTHTQF